MNAAWFNSLPDDNILHVTKLKAVADDNLYETQMMKFRSLRVENILGKGENAVTSIFSFF